MTGRKRTKRPTVRWRNARKNPVIRELCISWARADRAPAWYRKPLGTAQSRRRRGEARRWRRDLIGTDAFQKIAAQCPDARYLGQLIQFLAVWRWSPPDLNGLAQQWQDARGKALDVARVIRHFAEARLAEPDHAAALKLADRIEREPLVLMDEPKANQHALQGHEYALLGQQNDPRAFLIRLLVRRLPPTLRQSYAMIAKLLERAGFSGSTRQLVRATLFKGHT